MFGAVTTLSFFAILACQNLGAANQNTVSPRRQTMCKQVGSGNEAVLTILFLDRFEFPITGLHRGRLRSTFKVQT
jgi:hypothetical protein